MAYNKVLLQNQALNVNSMSAWMQVSGGLVPCVYSIQMAFTATCSFSSSIQISSDPYNNAIGFSPVHFDTLANSLLTFTTAGSYSYIVSLVGYVWARLVITDNSSGANTGLITATINVNN